MSLKAIQPCVSSLSINHVIIKADNIQRPRLRLFPNQGQHLLSFTELQCQSGFGLKTETHGRSIVTLRVL